MINRGAFSRAYKPLRLGGLGLGKVPSRTRKQKTAPDPAHTPKRTSTTYGLVQPRKVKSPAPRHTTRRPTPGLLVTSGRVSQHGASLGCSLGKVQGVGHHGGQKHSHCPPWWPSRWPAPAAATTPALWVSAPGLVPTPALSLCGIRPRRASSSRFALATGR